MLGRYLQRLLERYRLSRYDDFTIAEHFRRLGAQVGNDCRIQVRSLGSEPFLVRIGDHCTIASDVVMLTHDGATWVFADEYPDMQKFGTVEILDNCFIGYGAIIMPNVRIGPNAIVAAGSVVTKSVPANSVVGGCPAKPLCTLQEYKNKVVRIWAEQKPAGYLIDVKPGVRYAAHSIQARKLRDFPLLRAHLERTLWNR